MTKIVHIDIELFDDADKDATVVAIYMAAQAAAHSVERFGIPKVDDQRPLDVDHPIITATLWRST